MMMKNILLIFTLVFINAKLSAQIDKEPLPTQDATIIQVNTNSIFGKVVDLQNNKGIGGATVQLFAPKSDSLPGQKGDSLIAVMLSKRNGDFRFSKIPPLALYRLQISTVGYSAYDQSFSY